MKLIDIYKFIKLKKYNNLILIFRNYKLKNNLTVLIYEFNIFFTTNNIVS